MATSGNLKGTPPAQMDEDPSNDSSDVELEGVDLDDDLEVNETVEEDDDEVDRKPEANTNDATMAEEEAEELEEARKERMELMAAESSKQQGNRKNQRAAAPATAQEKLDYLLHQSDVFAHFLAGSVAATSKKKRGLGKASRSGKTGRLTEAEEDEQLLKSAASKRRIVRLETQPSMLSPECKMHAYQLEGLNWMIKLHDHGINGILADEMGLGKTLQTISLLAYLREGRGVHGPHLVIAPKSVVGNWIREVKMWCPAIRAIKMGGTKEDRKKICEQELPADLKTGQYRFDILVTSYEGALKERHKFSRVPWRYLIIDEAHRIKNEKSSLSLAVRTFQTQFRLLITGTPLQNNLRELFALLNFIMPEIFGDAEQFDEWFSLKDEHGKENVIKKLHTVLRPFMLRRVKKDVAAALPPKKETKLYIGLTPMQQEWYIRCLQKDAHELNKLGGPDRNRLMNVLMQLRKVCNHPYLFDGAEKGPPYNDGPHLWENAGKMQLIHKLLPKLQTKGSRVLIFSQMTRVLDILEDFCRFVGFEYCRIDGNTDGEKRDAQILDFNSEGSSKFLFLLSTRAGGLGINLATADIVILYDSDWNPQVDLQAMDRAHRLGQKKAVQVFRFITEGTVEEKIIERADRKLFLDAAVIQQGRLAEQHSTLEKGELMRMVRFGADQILSGTGGTYTDEDIDALIARGEERTAEFQAKLKTDAQHNLANFSLLADDGTGTDTFTFDGKNYRESDKRKVGNFINLPQRQRKRNYDERTNHGLSVHLTEVGPSKKKKKKGPTLHDFQLFDVEGINAIIEKERQLGEQKDAQVKAIRDLRQRAMDAPNLGSGHAPGQSKQEMLQRAEDMEQALSDIRLSDEDAAEKQELLKEGFPDWSRKDFKVFCLALERFGRYDFDGIARAVMNATNKELRDVQRYYIAFWSDYQLITDWQKLLDKIERGEKKILRLRQIRDAIQEKVERHLEETFGPHFADPSKVGPDPQLPTVAEMLHYSWPRLRISYGVGSRPRGYQEEEDAFLVCMMYRHGYGAAERIRMEIRRAWQFRFDWYFKSRPAFEIQKRCDTLVRIIERENAELHEKEQHQQTEAEGASPQPRADDDDRKPSAVPATPTSAP